ncbi:ECF transporter S component [Oceanobacillus sp. CAU 1775]
MENTPGIVKTKSQQNTYSLVITSMLIALVFIATFINIRLPIAAHGGLVHLGTGMLFIAAILFGPKKGAIAGAVGMGLFDFLGGWLLWTPITIIARGLQGFIVGKIAWAYGRKGRNIGLNIMAMIISTPLMIATYYTGEAIIYGNWLTPLASIPGDIVQSIIGMLIAIPICVALKKVL